MDVSNLRQMSEFLTLNVGLKTIDDLLKLFLLRLTTAGGPNSPNCSNGYTAMVNYPQALT